MTAVTQVMRRATRLCGSSVAIRGGLIATLGVYLVRAALSHDPSEAAGSRESMLRLGGLFEGRWFFALIALGFLAYAVDQALHAWCRRIREAALNETAEGSFAASAPPSSLPNLDKTTQKAAELNRPTIRANVLPLWAS